MIRISLLLYTLPEQHTKAARMIQSSRPRRAFLVARAASRSMTKPHEMPIIAAATLSATGPWLKLTKSAGRSSSLVVVQLAIAVLQYILSIGS